MAANLAVGANVSLKSQPGRWLKPFATSRALYLSTVPSALRLTLKTHLQPIAFRPGGRSLNSQVPFRLCASSSSSAACVHCVASERAIACTYVDGSGPNAAAKARAESVRNAPGIPPSSSSSSLTSGSLSAASSELSMIGVDSLCTFHHSPGGRRSLALQRGAGEGDGAFESEEEEEVEEVET